jgi:hypothetical protein
MINLRYEPKIIMSLRTISISKAETDDAKYEMIHHRDALVRRCCMNLH